MNKPAAIKGILIILAGIILSITSCVPYSKLKYTQLKKDETPSQIYKNYRSEKRIQSYDNLYIKIYSLDEKTTNVFSERSAFNMDQCLISYPVSDSGYVTLPFIERIKVDGLTLEEARKKIESSMNKYLNDISVTVRFVGNRVTLLGEVRNQGEYPFYDDKITIFQALGFAGGINDFGNKQSVTIVREINNEFTYHTVDLTSRDIVESNYYYLLPNDVIIVDPIRSKYRYLRDYTLYSTVFSSVSTIIAILYFFNVKL
ncbi:MAG TPA: polysaccharide biosynthesis/export family protein [Bacteroidales bacterium]|nr:polysaccharide biosynthesis/export family protein [Bacteroidales bacterium]